MAARNALVEANMGLVYLVVRRMRTAVIDRLGGEEDAAQVGCLGLIRAAEIFDATRGVAFSTYAYHSICRKIVGAARMRRRDRGVRSFPLPRKEPPGPAEPDAHEHDDLHAALARLPADERRLLTAYYFKGKKQDEIGMAQGVTKQWIATRLKLAREHLAAAFRPGVR